MKKHLYAFVRRVALKNHPAEFHSTIFHHLLHSVITGFYAGPILRLVKFTAVNIGATGMQVGCIQVSRLFLGGIAFMWLPFLARFRTKDIITALWLVGFPLLFFSGFHVGLLSFVLLVSLSNFFVGGTIPLFGEFIENLYPEKTRGAMYSIPLLGKRISFLAGLLAGSFILDLHPDAYRFFYPAIALLALSGTWIFRRIPEANLKAVEESRKSDVSGLKSIVVPLRDSRFLLFLASYTFAASGNFLYMTAYQFFCKQALALSANPNMVYGLLQATAEALILLTLPLWGAYVDRANPLRVMVTAWSLAAAGILLISLSFNPWIIGLGQVLRGAGTGGNIIGWFLFVLHFSKGRNTRAYVSLHTFFLLLRSVAGSAAGGYIIDKHLLTPADTLKLAALVIIAGTAWMAFIVSRGARGGEGSSPS